ncbi:unnamed protein product [Nippostrongylus brasiliensis]|uniref:FecR domain-containing protein n=1 Tax=Nippostrongylus brasiliensis TaxID=27835 RepID=A0A0N4YMB9_NIPBR|nr:unnamed protein product [Nippostrongylus brasiliensis]
MYTLPLLCATLAVFYQAEAAADLKYPLTLTISPRIWDVIDKRSGEIVQAVKSIPIPDLKGKKGKIRYEATRLKVTHFYIPKNGISFQNMANGVHIQMNGVQLKVNGRGRGKIGRRIRLLRITGGIQVKTTANINIKLTWNDFKFTPVPTFDGRFRFDFERKLRRLNFLRGTLEKVIDKSLKKKVLSMISDIVVGQLNPQLQQLKSILQKRGLSHYTMDWVVKHNHLRVALRNSGNIVGRFQTGLMMSCVAPELKCKGLSCTFCTDIDITRGQRNTFPRCNFPF